MFSSVSTSMALQPVHRSLLDPNQSKFQISSSDALLWGLRVPGANIPFVWQVPPSSNPYRSHGSGVHRPRYQERLSPANIRRYHRCRISLPIKGHLFVLQCFCCSHQQKKKIFVNFSRHATKSRYISAKIRILKVFSLDLNRSKYLLSSTMQKNVTIIERSRILVTGSFQGRQPIFRFIALPFGWKLSASYLSKFVRLFFRFAINCTRLRIHSYLSDFLEIVGRCSGLINGPLSSGTRNYSVYLVRKFSLQKIFTSCQVVPQQQWQHLRGNYLSRKSTRGSPNSTSFCQATKIEAYSG